MRSNSPRNRGFIIVELIGGLAITFTVVLLFVAVASQYAAARRESEAQRSLRCAAALALDRVRVGLPAYDAEVFAAAGVPTGVSIVAEDAAGVGVWQEFRQVSVVASQVLSPMRTIRFELSGYVPQGAPATTKDQR